MPRPVLALIKPPTAEERRGISRVLMLAGADIEAMMDDERRERREAAAGHAWLQSLVLAIEDGRT